MLPTQEIEIKPELKPHEVLAICLHFYNKGYYIQKIDNYYRTEFKFVDVNNMSDVNAESLTTFTNTYLTPGGKYEYRFTNDKKGYRNPPSTSIMFKYDGINIRFMYVYNEDQWNYTTIISTNIIASTNRHYRFFNDDEKANFFEAQNRIVKKLKFYDHNSSWITKIINDSYQSKKPYLTLEYIYGFKSYIENIKTYDVINYDILTQLIDCVFEDMQDNVTYNFKLLKFRKNNYNAFSITLNKSYEITILNSETRRNIQAGSYSMVDPIFKIILPIFEQVGGVSELKNVILHNRILTE